MYYGLVYLYVAIRCTVAASAAGAVTQKKSSWKRYNLGSFK